MTTVKVGQLWKWSPSGTTVLVRGDGVQGPALQDRVFMIMGVRIDTSGMIWHVVVDDFFGHISNEMLLLRAELLEDVP